MALHKSLTGSAIHVPYAFTYADATARTTATGFETGDIGKLALQSDENSLWMLTAVTPTWVEISGHTAVADAVSLYNSNATLSNAPRNVDWVGTAGGVLFDFFYQDVDTYTLRSAMFIGLASAGMEVATGTGAGFDSGVAGIGLDTTNGIRVTDSINGQGIRNVADYSANADARTLMDKGYIDGAIAAAFTGSVSQALFKGGGGGLLYLQTSSISLLGGENIGRIFFQAPDEFDEGISRSVGAAIVGKAGGAFSAAANPTDLAFETTNNGTLVERLRIDNQGRIIYGAPSALSNASGMWMMEGPTNDGTVAGPHMSFLVAGDGSPTMHIFPYAHDNMGILFDMYYDGSVFTSADAGTNFCLYKYQDSLWFGSFAGITKDTATGNPQAGGNHSMRIADSGTVHLGTAPATGTVTSFRTGKDGSSYWTGSTSGLPYAQMYSDNDATTTVTISTIDVSVQYTGFAFNGQSNVCVPDHTNDHITPTVAGVYFVTLDMLVTLTSATDIVEAQIRIDNGATLLTEVDMQLRSGSDLSAHGSVSGFISVSGTSTIEVWIRNRSNTNNVFVRDASLTIFQVGGN
ncbi:gp73 [Alphaproteobacteria phage PhiJL001]|uniref:Gp73 n=1 Tax=Alphaproteobacteria phage PhiJL001 TaxID=2681607 RepID=Q5DN32_9CAUD|nr:gp73 [Alphaproteobacteria phage PhiJL001]AAT69475.1 gp73 [Alphaproteobacteria phage PhiJL001]